MAQGPDNAIYGEIVLYDGEEGASASSGPRLIRVDGDPNVPGLVRLQGTLALDFGTPGGQLWKSNGDGTWTALSGGGGADTFVATNEWYVDTSAAPDAARRIFPTIAAAIADANSSLPPGDTVVLRLREDQAHAWDLSAGQDGTRPIVLFSHAETASAAPLLTLSNTLGGAAGPLWLYLDNLRLAGSAVIAGPWNLLVRKSGFVGGFTLVLDRTSGSSDALIQESDALIANSGGNHPIFVTFTGPDFPNSGTVTFQRSRIEYGDSNNPTLPGVEVNGVVYDHSVIRIVSQAPAFDASIGPVWVTPVGAFGEARFVHTMIEVELRGFSTGQLFNEVDPFSLTVVWDNVWVNAISVDPEGGPSVFSFGPRFDAGSFGGPPNRVHVTRGNLSSSVGFPNEITLPLDPPDGALAVDPGFTANRETSWRAMAVDKGFDPFENVWIAADGTTHWIGMTTDVAPTLDLTRTNSGLLDYQPLDQSFGLPGFRLQALVSAANQAGGGPVAVLQIDAVLEIGFGGPPVIVTQATTPLLDTSGGQFTAAVALDLVNNGFQISVSQGVDPSAFVDWHADVKLQSIAAFP